MKKLTILLGVILSAFAWGISPESQAAPQQPKLGGTLVVGQAKEFANPNPFINTSSSFQTVKETAYESLLTYDDGERIVPHLAEKYDLSAGGTVVALRLRKGVKFHNGKEMKADDVVWSANHVKDPKNGAFGQNIIKQVKTVEKINDYTVKFTQESPSATFLSHLATIRMLPIVPANSLRPGQRNLEANTFVPGTGPFIFERYQPGFDTVLKRFPEYWNSPAYLDKIIFRPITDLASRFNALRAGNVQMADRLSALDADRIQKGEIQRITILKEPLGGFRHLVFNYDNPLFRKLQMRQALLYATDKRRLVDEVYFGHARETDLLMPRESAWGKAANLPPHKRNLAKARELLEVAGYNGQELVLIGQKVEADLCESFRRILGEAGIKVKVEILEAGVARGRVREGKYDLHLEGGNPTSDPVITMIPEYYTTKTEKGRYSNARVDRLIDSLGSEFDQKRRLELFKDLAWLLHDDVASIPLFFEFRYSGMSEAVHGYGPPQGYNYKESGEYFKRAWLR